MLSGTVIGERYRIEREIGRGSFGVVYLAIELSTQQPRAIKFLLPWAADNEMLRHRLRREAKLASHLHGPHVVRIYECEESPEGIYLVMEYLQGRELDLELRERGALPAECVARLANQVLSALGEAHELGIIHRDLKPNNIFLCSDRDQDDFVKVFDFGIAKVSGAGNLTETAKLTMQGGVMGTPAYMSPEQCRGEPLTPASDFYSLGIVLYELLTGQVPFDDENPVQVLLMHNMRPLPPLEPKYGATDLGRTILRALEKEPRDRFASAAEFLDSLAGRPVARPAPAIQGNGTAHAAAQQPATGEVSRKAEVTPTPPPGDDASPRTVWTGLIVGGVVLLLVLLALAAWVAGG